MKSAQSESIRRRVFVSCNLGAGKRCWGRVLFEEAGDGPTETRVNEMSVLV